MTPLPKSPLDLAFDQLARACRLVERHVAEASTTSELATLVAAAERVVVCVDDARLGLPADWPQLAPAVVRLVRDRLWPAYAEACEFVIAMSAECVDPGTPTGYTDQ